MCIYYVSEYYSKTEIYYPMVRKWSILRYIYLGKSLKYPGPFKVLENYVDT